MARPRDRFAMLYTFLATVGNIALALMGEGRVDLYISMSILIYYVSYAIAPPSHREEWVIKALNLSLIAMFIAIVGIRVYAILTGE